MAKNVLMYPGGALEVGANIGTAFASGSPKAILSSLPEVINFYHMGMGSTWANMKKKCFIDGRKM